MTGPGDEPVGDPDEDPMPEPRTTAIAGGCLYTLMLTASVTWLAARDRLSQLPEAALGEHGVLIAAASGLGLGLLGYGFHSLVLRRLSVVTAMAAQVRQLFGAMGEGPVLTLVLIGAVAEELFFRLAVQDQFGLAGSVAAYTVMGTGAMGWRWMPLAALHAAALGSMMLAGCGLLATTTANAVMNYLILRRMLTS